MDGEALAAVLEGHDSLEEIFPSLSLRLKIVGTLKLLQKNQQDSEIKQVRALNAIAAVFYFMLQATF